jgi:hypothetical protein
LLAPPLNDEPQHTVHGNAPPLCVEQVAVVIGYGNSLSASRQT